jgi:hypothetical protein
VRIRLKGEVIMARQKKPPKPAAKPAAAKNPATKRPVVDVERAKLVDEMKAHLRRIRDTRLGPNATFEQESDAGFESDRSANPG